MPSSPSDKIADHAEQARLRLPGFQQDASNWSALFQVLCDGVQNIEDVLEDFVLLRAISTAVGEQLDQIGTIINRARDDETDDQYRISLAGEAARIGQSGEIETLIQAFRVLTGASLVILAENYPASVHLTAEVADAEDSTTDNAILAAMQRVVAAGVQLSFEYIQAPMFLWGDVADVLPDVSAFWYGDDALADGDGDVDPITGHLGWGDVADVDVSGDLPSGGGGEWKDAIFTDPDGDIVSEVGNLPDSPNGWGDETDADINGNILPGVGGGNFGRAF